MSDAEKIPAGRRSSPSLRRKRGSEDMSAAGGGLRVVNISEEAEEEERSEPLLDPDEGLMDDSGTTSPAEALRYSSPVQPQMAQQPSSASSPPSLFDLQEEEITATEPTTMRGEEEDQEEQEQDLYDLKPPPMPPSNGQNSNLETLSKALFSQEHLDLLLRDPKLSLKFHRFLDQYRPQHQQLLRQYTDIRKAVAAVNFANAVVAGSIRQPAAAATLDAAFETKTREILDGLLGDALPAYLTHCLVLLVTDTLVKEITGTSSPIMHALVPSLAEVYCISDPHREDNPIVYASEEFYATTQYSQEQVIGRNCRFLQGPQTSPEAIRRLIAAQKKGEEICELVLNYKRNGTPFYNLLLITPLKDHRNAVRYFLGAQIDVSSLIRDGNGLESFARLLHGKNEEREERGSVSGDDMRGAASWRELTLWLSEEERESVRNRESTTTTTAPATSFVSQKGPASVRSAAAGGGGRPTPDRSRNSRVVLGMDETPAQGPPPLWPKANLGSSGRLPGVYQNYLLVRPAPSLRITFTSPTLRIPGLLQTKLLDRIAGPPRIKQNLEEALSRGTTGVTAKIAWLTRTATIEGAGGESKSRFLHCTPLFDANQAVGVWMVVVVEPEQITGALNGNGGGGNGGQQSRGPSRGGGGGIGVVDAMTSKRLYAEYLREGQAADARPRTQETTSSVAREAVEQFRDF
ncbi:K+-channel ERG [Lecanosticta acicola]|uniref:K+-channel ERG n=1 Tax=Lecanosticta acicola TaxID=111012 RepID=A0AAI9E9G4_9PEZI|nr:K+-channel ERG [Lecanosticta acicola]